MEFIYPIYGLIDDETTKESIKRYTAHVYKKFTLGMMEEIHTTAAKREKKKKGNFLYT